MAENKNALTLIANMQISTRARQVLKHADEELAAGIAAPFAVIGFKGGKWSVRSRGTVKELENPDGSSIPFIDVVVLYAASHHSKIYYAKVYQDGDDDVPDCWSTDGIKPDQAAPHKQNPICEGCRHNAFGSRINQATGSKGKACQDVRRLAISPYPDLENEMLGGPMLLRIPPATLSPFAEYSDFLKANTVPYSAIVTKIGFEKGLSYPRFIFQPKQALTDDEIDRVARMQSHPLTDRIVSQQLENIVDQPGSEAGTANTEPGPKPVTNGKSVPHESNQPEQSDNAFARAQGKTEAVQRQQATPAPAPQPTQKPAPAPALSPEQARLKELEAEIARLKAGTEKPARRRSKPVAPSTEAETLPPPDADDTGTGDDAAEDPALAAINARLDEVMQ